VDAEYLSQWNSNEIQLDFERRSLRLDSFLKVAHAFSQTNYCGSGISLPEWRQQP
jgi:hypothetical protein